MQFKGHAKLCENELDFTAALLERGYPAMQRSVPRTYSELEKQEEAVRKRLDFVNDGKADILNLYKDGIASLKRYELHPAFAKKPQGNEGGEKKQHLIDIYYAESSMNNFKQNCITQLEKITAKMQSLGKEFTTKFSPLVSRYNQGLQYDRSTLIQAHKDDLARQQATVRTDILEEK